MRNLVEIPAWKMLCKAFCQACGLALALTSASLHAEEASALYLANEGVLVSHGATKVAFDPIFRSSFGQYLLLPDELEAALFAGTAPFDDLDAVFISHYHGDHFSATDILQLMLALPDLALFAPAQAITAMRSEGDIEGIMQRVHQVSLEYGDTPMRIDVESLAVEAVRIPHSGWPDSRLDVENIAWRVTLDDATTVLHLGDADPRDVHFAKDPDFWQRDQPHVAFPPYWFLGSSSGREILEERVGAASSIGIHVPVQIPADPLQRPPELRSADLFITPGESRRIRH